MHSKINRIVFLFLAATFFAGCKKEGSLFKTLPPSKTGISFHNDLTASDDLNILDYLYFYNGGGVAIGDINQDGLPDVFFSGNQVKNALYLNKGNMVFEDITEKAGVSGNSSWNTGAVMGDVNGDGLLDIYVCAVVGLKGFGGHNELFINNGDLSFTESSVEYALDYDTYSSSAAFLDYDQDGDLDLYLLNHAVHTQESFGKAELRNSRNFQTGDKLLRNDNGTFEDVSEEAGIYGGVNGYGLGVAVSDFNKDGYPDIYVGNDFHEDDYYYLNNGDGTFTERLRDYFEYSTRFSMGNDVSDINHDGWPDIMSLDMLPEDEKVLKSSEGDDNIQTQKMRIKQYGYHYQFTRNMLFLNQPEAPFSEIALMGGVAATDWSWSALFADYNQDGEQDVFVSNGIPKRPNDLDFINFVSNEAIKKKINSTKLVDQQALDLMPSGNVHNYVFKGTSKLIFEDMSGDWIQNDTIVSGATAIADLDNDGDLDLITNNINSPPTIYQNKTDENANYLKVALDYKPENAFGIGTKVYSYHQGTLQFKELYTARGFQASSEPIVHFGYGENTLVDSLRIVWPDQTTQKITAIEVNQLLTIRPENTRPYILEQFHPQQEKLFRKSEDNLGIDFVHKEDNYIDFNRQKLIPYQISDRGPATEIGDINNDGKDDVFFGGSKFIPPKVFIQQDTAFTDFRIPDIVKDSVKEDVAALIGDLNGDGRNDLFLGSGGADFYNQMRPLLDSYYLGNSDSFEAVTLPKTYENAAVIEPYDYDGDGDLDLFVGNQAVSADFGKIPRSYILENENGQFSLVENNELEAAGMVTDAIWEDFDSDGRKDLILVGEWMSPKFFRNEDGKLKEANVAEGKLHGLWQSIEAYDIDGDGDTDYLLGNWGTNSKFRASAEYPLKMYYSDFDRNGSTETVVALEKKGQYYPLEGLDGLASQMVQLKKKFNTYSSFAGKTVEEIFEKEVLDKAEVRIVEELQSGYLKNENGRFRFIPFTETLQVAPIMDFLIYDFDADGQNDALAAGNYFGVKPFHGRFGAFPGALIKGAETVIAGYQLGLDLNGKSVRHLNMISVGEQPYLLVTFNDEASQIYELTKH